MKKMKLFPKTFLYTFFMLLFITTSMHLMIYFFYPKVYLSRMQDQLEKKMETLQQEIKRNTAAEAGQIFSDFAKQNNVNVTVECAGSEVTYMGMDFQISLYTDADMVFDVSNLENAESIIVKNKTMEADDGIEIQVEVMASAMPVKEAVDMITFLLPFTFGATILFSIVFSYLYSRRITRPIFHMLNVTNDMKNLKPEAAFHVQDEDEVGLLAEQINQVYEQLGGTMGGTAKLLLRFGDWLGSIMPVLCGIIFVIVLVAAVIACSKRARGFFVKLYKKVFGGHGIVRRMGEARFASAMAMGMMSGLNTEDAFRTAMLFQDVNQKTKKRYEKCLEMLEVGEPMAKSFRENEVLEASFCRILDLGAKSGTSDTAMAEISRRMDDRVQLEIARKVGKIEPTIVIITSILVGIVLITVMLPLIHIMSSIG